MCFYEAILCLSLGSMVGEIIHLLHMCEEDIRIYLPINILFLEIFVEGKCGFYGWNNLWGLISLTIVQWMIITTNKIFRMFIHIIIHNSFWHSKTFLHTWHTYWNSRENRITQKHKNWIFFYWEFRGNQSNNNGLAFLT